MLSSVRPDYAEPIRLVTLFNEFPQSSREWFKQSEKPFDLLGQLNALLDGNTARQKPA